MYITFICKDRYLARHLASQLNSYPAYPPGGGQRDRGAALRAHGHGWRPHGLHVHSAQRFHRQVAKEIHAADKERDDLERASRPRTGAHPSDHDLNPRLPAQGWMMNDDAILRCCREFQGSGDVR